MCLLLVFYKHIPGYPLVLCANRDEYYDRPAEPPIIWDQDTPFLAPRDERAKGTWIGLNAASGVAAVTNRRGVPVPDEAPSRGRLCAELLACGAAPKMVKGGLELAGRHPFNGFNLLVADPEHAWLLKGGGREVTCVGLSPGVHVLTNEHDLDVLPPPEGADTQDLMEKMCAYLKSHEPLSDDGFAPCKHMGNRGTRSATVIALGKEDTRFLFADGPPCTHPFEDLSATARALLEG